jgi:murein DD-endopeptidase MepM/ murein hydrolase activator NlpD
VHHVTQRTERRECQTAFMGMQRAEQGPAIRVRAAAALVLVLLLALALWFLVHGGQVKGPFSLCPVAGGIVKDNFGAPRSDHTHYGDDVYADLGAPVLATFEGTISNSQSAGGLIVTLEATDGSFTVGKHLSATTTERQVQSGDVIGYVGRLDVPGALPHLHFEWHPQGGPAVDPFPYLSEVCPGIWRRGEGLSSP